MGLSLGSYEEFTGVNCRFNLKTAVELGEDL